MERLVSSEVKKHLILCPLLGRSHYLHAFFFFTGGCPRLILPSSGQIANLSLPRMGHFCLLELWGVCCRSKINVLNRSIKTIMQVCHSTKWLQEEGDCHAKNGMGQKWHPIPFLAEKNGMGCQFWLPKIAPFCQKWNC